MGVQARFSYTKNGHAKTDDVLRRQHYNFSRFVSCCLSDCGQQHHPFRALKSRPMNGLAKNPCATHHPGRVALPARCLSARGTSEPHLCSLLIHHVLYRTPSSLLSD